MFLFSVNWTQSSVLAFLESSLKHIPYFTFLDTISHSDLIDPVLLLKQQLPQYSLCYILPDIHCFLTFSIQPKDVPLSVGVLYTTCTIFSKSQTFFQALVSIICSIIDIMSDAFLGVKSAPAIYCTSCLAFCIFHFGFPFCCTGPAIFPHYLFWSILFTCLHVVLNSFSSICRSNFISYPLNCTILPRVCIVNITSSLIELLLFLVSKLPWST